jgi:hypothetical protein
MKLTATERERITDGMLKIQSVRASLDHVDASKIPNHQEIEACLESADHGFRKALGYARQEHPAPAATEPSDNANEA